MALDRAFLAEHTIAESSEGFREEVAFIRIGQDRCFSVLTRPDHPSTLGFVVCHSYGLELLTLRRTERAVSRTLGRMGFPVLALHRRGFGDSTGSLAEATLDRQVEDVWAAAEFLARTCGTGHIGFIGGRFGGLVAVAAARRGGVDRLLLMAPSLNGEAYFTQAIREKSLVETARMDGGSRRSLPDLMDDLHRDGIIDVLGHPIYLSLYESTVGLDLEHDVGGFAGDALVIDISKGSKLSHHVEQFRASVTANGGTCRVEHLVEPPRARFGGAAFVSTTADPTVRVDVLKPLVEQVNLITEEWLS